MKTSPLLFTLLLILFPTCLLQLNTHAAPAAPLVKHLSSLLKWTTSSSKTRQSEGNFLKFENGYLVETVAEGNELGFVPHSIRVSQDSELFAVDSVNSNIVRITPPLSQYSRARLVAGSFQGYTGHVDGKPSDARFNHPKGVTMDDRGNVYIADTSNLAIRKIGEAGVTTIAGGKSNVAGYRDGPSEDAKFSTDFDVVYIRPICSLLVVDRGNAALRQISLNKEDCHYENSSISTADICMVIAAVLIGYAFCLLQQGFGPSFFSKEQQQMESESQEQPNKEKHTSIIETIKEEQEAGWPSFRQLIVDWSKLLLEALGSVFPYLIPRFKGKSSKTGLTPLKDSLIMPQDEPELQTAQKQRTPAPLSETREAHIPSSTDKYSEAKLPKVRSTNMKDPSLSTKHRSSKKQEYAEYYGTVDAASYGHIRSKSHKERTKHRQRDKSGEVAFGIAGVEPKPVEVKPMNYDDHKYDRYNFRSKYADSYRFE